ncbi:hypothetical protein [Arthrobacter crystallopoietes]|nr:hypothetical protein [Arthrobacter crystallopoietes]
MSAALLQGIPLDLRIVWIAIALALLGLVALTTWQGWWPAVVA